MTSIAAAPSLSEEVHAALSKTELLCRSSFLANRTVGTTHGHGIAASLDR